MDAPGFSVLESRVSPQVLQLGQSLSTLKSKVLNALTWPKAAFQMVPSMGTAHSSASLDSPESQDTEPGYIVFIWEALGDILQFQYFLGDRV